MTFSLRTHGLSETGKVRKMNQDSCLTSPNLVVVADGMGGAAAGDLASAVVIHELSKVDGRYSGEETLEVMAGVLAKINDQVADLISTNIALLGMGSTLTGVMFSGDQYAVTNIGDSRTYLLRDGELTQLTHDHSFVQQLVDEQKISASEAEHHPHRSLLLKVINGQSQHEADFKLLDARLGDRLLICSDGLCGFVEDDQILELLSQEDPEKALSDLLQAAYEGDSSDNVSIIVSDVVEQSDELDQAEPQILGAAAIVDLAEAKSRVASLTVSEVKAAVAAAEDLEWDEERARYAPTSSKRRRVLPIVSSIAAIAILGGAGYGGYRWTQTQYFVGVHQGQVAIYQGVPGQFLGFKLNHMVELQPIQVEDLPVHYREKVRANITVSSLAGAKDSVAELKTFADYCISQRQADSLPTYPASSTSTSVGYPTGTEPTGEPTEPETPTIGVTPPSVGPSDPTYGPVAPTSPSPSATDAPSPIPEC